MTFGEHWAGMPSFVLGQALFLALAFATLIHAVRGGLPHRMIWVGALVAGTANDFIFMALPLVDNFWQAEGVVMISPRMPLYIPAVYVCFLYIPTVAARRLLTGRWARSAATGLAASLFYAPYDIVGARFLWWTWHDTDQPIAERILGAPCSSTLWVVTFAGAFALLVDHTLRGRDEVTGGRALGGVAKLAAFTTLMMMPQMTVLQQVDGGCPGYGALGVGVLIYAVLVARGRPTLGPLRNDDRWLGAAVVAYAVGLATIGASFDPETHRSTGIHQEIGECYVEQSDITGFTRFEFLCPSDFDEEFVLCDGVPADGTRRYTICGTPHSARGTWTGGVLLLAFGVAGLFGFLLRRPPSAV